MATHRASTHTYMSAMPVHGIQPIDHTGVIVVHWDQLNKICFTSGVKMAATVVDWSLHDIAGLWCNRELRFGNRVNGMLQAYKKMVGSRPSVLRPPTRRAKRHIQALSGISPAHLLSVLLGFVVACYFLNAMVKRHAHVSDNTWLESELRCRE